jgi:hypothetical protein
MDIKGMILNRFSGASGSGKIKESEPLIDKNAVGKFLEDLPKSTNGTRALSLEEGVIILLPQVDIDKIVSPKTSANTELILRALVGNEQAQEAGLRNITVGRLLPYLANDQIQQSVKQSNLNPEAMLAVYKDIQIQNSGNALAKPVIIPERLSDELDTAQEVALNTKLPDSSIQVPVKPLDGYVRDPITDEVIQVHGMKAQDLKGLLPPALQAELFPVEEWKEISQGESPRMIPVGQRKNSGELPILPGESRRIVVSPLAQQEGLRLPEKLSEDLGLSLELPPPESRVASPLVQQEGLWLPETIKEITPNHSLDNKEVVANLGNNLDQATTPEASNQRRTRRRSSATNSVEE